MGKIKSQAPGAVSAMQRPPQLVLLDSRRTQAAHLMQCLANAHFEVKLFHSGRRLLTWLNTKPADVVLVNIEDGGQADPVIAQIRNRFPLLPILAIAVNSNAKHLQQSIRQGANYFISDISDEKIVTSTVSRLLQFRMEHLRYTQVLEYMRSSIDTAIPSRLEFLGGMVYYLTEEMFKYGIIGLNQINAKIALVEALTNAMEHGNKLDPEKKVRIKADFSFEQARFEIEDEGSGFKFESLPDPTAKENLFRPRGRGIFMMRQFMDEVTFIPPGNRVILIKKRTGEGAPPRPYPWERRVI